MADALLQSFSLLQTRLDETFTIMSGNIVVVNSGPIGPTGALGPTGGNFVGPTGATGLSGAQGATGVTGATGAGVPAGGSTGQILAKKSGATYDTEWVNNSGGAAGATGQFTFNSGSGSTGSAALSYSPTGPPNTSATGATIRIGAHLVPTANQIYDLGATGLAFRDLYLKGSTIYLGGQSISTDGTGLSFNGNAIAGPNTVSEKFTVAAGGGGLAYSYDGLSWIESASGAALFTACTSVAWNGSMWVAGGYKIVSSAPTGVIAHSSDGINWIASEGITDIFSACLAIAWNGTLWVAGGVKIVFEDSGAIAYSDDGITWTASTETIPDIFTSCLGFAWNGSLWFAVGYLSSAGALATSADGETWTASEAISVIFSLCNAITWNGSLLVAVGELNSIGVIATSADGETWQALELNITSTSYNAVAWNGSMWVVGGYTGADDTAIIAYSYNGTTWFQSENLSTTLSTCKSIAWNGSVWLAGTTNAAFSTKIAYSYDGYSWTGIGVSSIFASQCLGLASRSLLYTGTRPPPIPPGGDMGQVLAKASAAPYDLTWTTAGGGANVPTENFMVAGGYGSNRLIYTYDGINWLVSTNGNDILTTPCNTVAWNGSLWLAGGEAVGPLYNSFAYSSDGIRWTAGFSDLTVCYAIAWNGTMWVAGGSGTTKLAYSYDGLNWVSVGGSIFTTACRAVAWNGSMWVAGGNGTNQVAYSYDGINWLGSTSGNGKLPYACYTVAWNGSMWVAGGDGGSIHLIYSYNGIDWTAANNDLLGDYCFAVAWNGSRWVAAGQGNSSLIYSDNGISWTLSTNGSTIITVIGRSVAWNGSLWVAGGDNDDGVGQTAYSYDGDNWFASSASALITSTFYSVASRRPLPYVGTQVRTIPAGGDTGQVLSKRSGAPYDLTWTTAGGGPVGATGQFTFNSGSGSTGSAALSYSPTGTTGVTGPRIIVGAHLVPNAHQTYDIGATGLAFRDIYLKGSTIHLGNQKISTDGTGIFFNNSPLQNFKIYTYELDGASPITITPPSNCVAARITMSGGGGGGGNSGDEEFPGGGGAAGACSIHMVPIIGASNIRLTLGVGGGYPPEAPAGGGGGGATVYSFNINRPEYNIYCGGGGGGSGGDSQNGGPGTGTGGGSGGTVDTVATHGTTITPFGGYLEYNTLLLAGNTTSGDGGNNASGTPGVINPLGGYGGAGAGAGGTAGAGGFAIFEWIYR